MLAHGLPGDLAPGIEDPRHDRRVHVGHEPLQYVRAVHHRDPRHAHVVLDRDALARERPGGRALDRALPVPRVEPVLARRRPVARVSRVLDGERRLGELVEAPVGGEDAVHQVAERDDVLGRDVEVVRPRDPLQFIEGRFSEHPRGRLGRRRSLHRGVRRRRTGRRRRRRDRRHHPRRSSSQKLSAREASRRLRHRYPPTSVEGRRSPDRSA